MKQAKRRISMDMGTITAVVVKDPGLPVVTDLWDLRVRPGESIGIRYLRFRRALRELLEVPTEWVGYEMPGRFKSGAAAQVLLGLIAHMQAACDEAKVPYYPVAPADAKREATGKGNAGKPAMVAAARERWPELDVTDDNIADALWVSVCAERDLG